jgi:hypothetical protein
MSRTVHQDWIVFLHEWDMFRHLVDLMTDPDAIAEDYSSVVRNAIAESACLHARQLVDMFLPSGGSKPDDIHIRKLIDGFNHPVIAEIVAWYGLSTEPATPRWKLNKLIAHPTSHRGSSADFGQLILELREMLKLLSPAIEGDANCQRVRESQRRQSVKLYHMALPENAKAMKMPADTQANQDFWDTVDGLVFSPVPPPVDELGENTACLQIILSTSAEEMFYELEIVPSGKPRREFFLPRERIDGCPGWTPPPQEADAARHAVAWNEYPPGQPEAKLAERRAGKNA